MSSAACATPLHIRKPQRTKRNNIRRIEESFTTEDTKITKKTNAGLVQQLSHLSHEIVIVFVRADPKPDDEIAMLLGKSAIVIADSR
jgi:hypothetical protein